MITSIKRIVVLLFAATLLAAAQAAPAFPVKYSANNRYLVDQNGVPFPIMGRTAWFITSLSVADYHTFIDDTAARGFSAIELHVINHDPRGNHPPFDGNSNRPFLNRLNGTSWNGALTYGNINNEAPNFTTPNEAYWSFVDSLLAYAETKGILVFLFPAYVGYAGGSQGWMQEIVANGTTKMQSYGAWIATRYKNQKNLVWMMGGDMGTSPNTFNTAQNNVESALLTGLKSVASQQSTLFSAEWTSESIGTDQTTFGTSMTINGAYSWSGKVNSHGRRAYAYTPVKPAILLEEPYDQEGSDGNGVNPSATQPVRRFQWWGWLSTIGGYISGNGYVWPFNSPAWSSHLDTQGSRDMARLNAFMGSIAWYKLVPSGLGGMRTLVTAGGSSVSSSDYVTAAAAPDGTLLVAYVPPAHNGPITVDMRALSGPTRARWFDPTSGAYNGIGTGLTNTGSRSFTTPGNNSVGSKDWVLVLDYATGNTPALPTISDISDQSTTVNTPTTNSFTINDADTPVDSLTLSGNSSNPALVPTNNIIFGGSGSNRMVTVTPATGQTGAATITVSVSDGTNSASDMFVLTVNAVNTPPTITGISNQTISVNGTTGPLSFTVGDVESAAGNLTLNANSSNPALVTLSNIVLGDSGANRTVTVTPASNQTGSATITVSVSDGQFTTSTNFGMTVSSLFTEAKAFTNTAAITIPYQGAGTPYPSVINVTGVGGTITNVTVTLRNLTHTWKADVDALLVSPGGQKVLVMSDCGNIYTPSGSVTLTLSDLATVSVPSTTALATGTFKPTDYSIGSADVFNTPAPAEPYGSNMATFNGQSPNGTWSLYVMDDGPGDQGNIAGGWSLTVVTTTPPAPGVLSVEAPPQISRVEFDSRGTILVTVSGTIGLSYALEASSEQANWTQVDVQDNKTGSVVFTEQPTTNSIRFYRAVSMPK